MEIAPLPSAAGSCPPPGRNVSTSHLVFPASPSSVRCRLTRSIPLHRPQACSGSAPSDRPHFARRTAGRSARCSPIRAGWGSWRTWPWRIHAALTGATISAGSSGPTPIRTAGATLCARPFIICDSRSAPGRSTAAGRASLRWADRSGATRWLSKMHWRTADWWMRSSSTRAPFWRAWSWRMRRSSTGGWPRNGRGSPGEPGRRLSR